MLEGKCCVVLRTILGPHVGIEAIRVDRGPSRATEAGEDSGGVEGEVFFSGCFHSGRIHDVK
jgi:hypothetical protein